MLESILNGNLFGSGQGAPLGGTSGFANNPESKLGHAAPRPIEFPETPVGGVSLSAAERYSNAESFSLELTTKEGDKVTIKFDHASSYEASLGATSDAQGGSAAVFNVSRSERNQFQFEVQGDLNDNELESIQNLIQDVSLIANDFFDGDVQAAFDRASEYQMDRSQLGSMELHMSRSQQYTAVAAYQEVQQVGEHGNNSQKLGQMTDMLNQQRQDSGLNFIDQLSSLQEQILDSLVENDTRYREADEDAKDKYDENRNTLYSMLDD